MYKEFELNLKKCLGDTENEQNDGRVDICR